MNSKKTIKSAFESMMYVWGQPLDVKTAADIFNISKEDALSYFLELKEEYEQEGRGIVIRQVNKSFQFVTRPENAEFIERLCTPVKVKRLSQSALEVLAIIAYKQPVTKGEIDAIRGIKCDRVIEGLIKKELVCDKGRSNAIGRPILYGTTDTFLKNFGFTSLKELPDIEDIESAINIPDEEDDGMQQITMSLEGEDGENPKINCPNCDEEIVVILKEFVDVSTDPIYKEQIMNGDFFLVTCPECGDQTLVEYPVMYIDPDKKLNIYMAPDHEDDLLEQLNSVDIPEADIDASGIFRVVNNSAELLEKILMADSNRDDRVMELYKAVICENIKDQWPGLQPMDLLYMDDGAEEYFIIWSSDNEDGEKLTVTLDEDLYNQLESDYLEALMTEPNKYVEVNQNWLLERIDTGE